MRAPRRSASRPQGLVGGRPTGRTASGSLGLARLLKPLRPERAAPNPWGLSEAVFGFVIGLLLASLAASAAGRVVGYHTASNAPLPVAVTVADVAALWLGLLGAALVATRRHGAGSLVRDLGLRAKLPWDIVVGAAIGVAGQYLLIPAVYLPFEQLDHGLAHSLASPAHRETAAAHGSLQIAVLFVFLAIGAPIVEELFFRGLVLRALLARLPVPIAIAASAVAFALAHFEAVQFAGLAVFGVVLGLLAWRTGRLGPGIAAHAAFNATAVLSLVHLHVH